VVAGDRAFADWKKNIASFGACGFISVDDDAGALQRRRIGLSGVRLEGADEIEVCARAQVASVEERSGACGASAKNIGFSGEGSRIGCEDGDSKLGRDMADEFGSALRFPAANQDASEVAHQRQDCEVSAGEVAGAENAERAGIFAGKIFRGDRGCGGSAQGGEIVGGNREAGLSGFGIEEKIGGMHAILAGSAMAADGNEFDSEGRPGWIVTRHDEQHSGSGRNVRAGSNGDGGKTVAEGSFDSVDHLNRIEASANIAFAEARMGVYVLHGTQSE